jgi:hypothetical protein
VLRPRRAGPPGAATGPIWGGGGPGDAWRLAAASTLLFVYAGILSYAGYLLATAGVLFALLLVYNPGRVRVDAIVAVAFAVASYYVFHVLLGVYVPKGPLG